MSYLLLHVVTLPDHVSSALHKRKGDPAIRYPVLQARKAWEPNEDSHEGEVMFPLSGGSRTGHDFPEDKGHFPLINSLRDKNVLELKENKTKIIENKSLVPGLLPVISSGKGPSLL